MSIFQLQSCQDSKSSQSGHPDEADYHVSTLSVPKPVAAPLRPKNGWKHDSEYVMQTLEKLMPPPFESTPVGQSRDPARTRP